MLYPACWRSRPSPVVSPSPKFGKKRLTPPKGMRRRNEDVLPKTGRLSAFSWCSAPGFIFSPVMYAAGGVMNWRLQRDGFVTHDIATSGGSVRLWDAPGQGGGPCVVFIHGLGGSSCEYRDTLVWLQSKCRRVIALDMPSHGGSTSMGRDGGHTRGGRRALVDDFQMRINQTLDTFLDEPVHMVGHSLGGYAAMRYALEGAQRRRVQGLVLVSPDGAPWTSQERADDRAMFEVKSYTQAADIAARTYPQQPVRAACLTPFVRARFATPRMQYLNHSDVKQPVLSHAQLAALPSRIRLVFGRQERFDPPHNLIYFCAHMPSSMTLKQPDTGHGDIVDAHPAVLAAMEDFLT